MDNLSRRGFLAAAAAAGATAMLGPALPAEAQAPMQTTRASGLKVGFVLSSEQFTSPELVNFSARAEAAGFDAVWSSDHIQPWQPNEGHTSFAWINLAAAGQKTSKVLMGTGVCCPTIRYRPPVVAEAFATLGQLYPGRVFLGVGTGEALNEVTSTGLKFPHYRERAARLVEAVTLIRQLWTGQMVSFEGKYYQTRNMKLYDVPSVPVPIWIAGNGPKSARMAGQYGDGWITTEKLLNDPTVKGAFEEGARAAGKDPSKMAIAIEEWFVNGSQADAAAGAELWRFLPRAWKSYVTDPDPRSIQSRAEKDVAITDITKDWTVSTNPQDHANAVKRMARAGATHIFVHTAQPDQLAFIRFFQGVLPLV